MNWIWFALLAALGSGIAFVVQKKSLTKEHSLHFSAVLSIIVAIFSIILIPFVDFSIPIWLILVIYLASWLGTLAFYYSAHAIRHLGISEVAPFYIFGPIFVAFFAFILLGEEITRINLVGLLILVIGAYVLEVPKNMKSFFQPFQIVFKSKYIKYVFFALILWGITAALDKFFLDRFFDKYTLLFFAQIFIAVNFIILIYIKHEGFEVIKKGFKNSWKIISLMAMLAMGYRLSYLQAVSLYQVSLVYPIYRLSSLFATIIGGEFFHEKNILKKSIAVIIMLLGSYLIVT